MGDESFEALNPVFLSGKKDVVGEKKEFSKAIVSFLQKELEKSFSRETFLKD